MTQFTSGAWAAGSIEISITNLQTLLTTIFANGDANMLVCVAKIIPNTGASDANITTWNGQMATMVAAHANTSRIFTADCNGDFKANAGWAVDYMNDATHPNSAGKAVMGATIQAAIQSNVTLTSRTPASSRRAIKPHTAALRYTASTGTTLGVGTTLNTASPWAISMDIDLSRSSLATNNGLLRLETDQATPFIFLALGTSARYLEWGSNANFDRFFPNITVDSSIRDRCSKGWHQLVWTFDGVARATDTSYKFYIDGRPIVVTNGAGLAATTDDNSIGAAVSGGSAGTFDMADLTIWNGGTTMTAAQAEAWYFNHIVPTGPTLIRRYQHADGSGSTLTDSTGNQNGTIGTATWITSSLPTMARKLPDTARTAATARTTAT